MNYLKMKHLKPSKNYVIFWQERTQATCLTCRSCRNTQFIIVSANLCSHLPHLKILQTSIVKSKMPTFLTSSYLRVSLLRLNGTWRQISKRELTILLAILLTTSEDGSETFTHCTANSIECLHSSTLNNNFSMQRPWNLPTHHYRCSKLSLKQIMNKYGRITIWSERFISWIVVKNNRWVI